MCGTVLPKIMNGRGLDAYCACVGLLVPARKQQQAGRDCLVNLAQSVVNLLGKLVGDRRT